MNTAKLSKQMMKEAFLDNAFKVKDWVSDCEKALGRELLYRYIFGYPKKWSKRKVKKKGKKDMDLLKLETAVHLGFDGIKKLGSEYKQYIEENFEVEVKVRE